MDGRGGKSRLERLEQGGRRNAGCIPTGWGLRMALDVMSWAEVLSVLNGAGLIAAVGIVTVAGMATLLFRRW
jgi:hypothetical protein